MFRIAFSRPHRQIYIMDCPNCKIPLDTQNKCPKCGIEAVKPDSLNGQETGLYSVETEGKPADAEKSSRVVLVNDVNMFGRKVAIKRFSHAELSRFDSTGSDSHETEEKLVAEAKIITELKHPNIIDIYFVGKYKDGVQVVMEYIEGDNLDRTIRAKGPADTESAALIGMQICEGLTMLHDRSVIHGNIRPENIMLNDQNVPKLVGFGPVPELIGPNNDDANAFEGYMAPERLKNRERNPRSDIYSLGAVLYFAVTGEPPVDPDFARLPEGLVEPVTTAMNVNPDNRFSSIREMGEALSNVFIGRRHEKIISRESGDFSCYRCESPVPPTASFCPSCGIEIKMVWREKESLYRETVKSVEKMVIEGLFGDAVLKLDQVKKDFTHQHFLHLSDEIANKKIWVQEEWNKADHKKEKLLNRLKTAEAAVAGREYDSAAEIAEDIKQHREPYFKTVYNGACKVIDEINRIKSDEKRLQEELSRFHEKALSYIKRGDFETADSEIRMIIESINRPLFPEVFQEAVQEREWLKSEKEKADLVFADLKKRIDEAVIALETLNLDAALQIARSLEDIDGGYYQTIVEQSRKITEDARKIISTRKEMERNLSRVQEKASAKKYATAFHLLDRILATPGKAYENQRQRAAEAREKITLERRNYIEELRELYAEKLVQAEKTMVGAKTILNDIISNQDDELEDLRESAKEILRRRFIRNAFALAGVFLILLIIGIMALKSLDFSGGETSEVVQIFTKRANFRTGPNTTFEVVESIKRDENLSLLAKGVRISPDGHPWMRVYIPELDKEGYVSAKLLVNEEGRILFLNAEVITDDCKVMERPRLDSRYVGVLKKGVQVALQRWEIDDNEQIWYFCDVEGAKGYIGASNLKLLPSGEFAVNMEE